MKKVHSVEEYLENNSKDMELLFALRTVILSTELTEEIKWSVPTYTYKGKNVIGLAAFKSYVGVWFHEGALLSDFSSVLINAQEGTKALRQWRFNSLEELDEDILRSYIQEAMQNVDHGKSTPKSEKVEIDIPVELKEVFDKESSLLVSFNQLTAFKQREFCEYILDAKRQQTKLNRLEKIIPMISKGIGLNDKYRK